MIHDAYLDWKFNKKRFKGIGDVVEWRFEQVQKDMKEAYCPYCLDGVIVKDKIAGEIFFCSACKREVKVRRFE